MMAKKKLSAARARRKVGAAGSTRKKARSRSTAVAATRHRVNHREGDLLWDRVITHGQEVAYQTWDSGGPGAGAGQDSVYRYGRLFYVGQDSVYRYGRLFCVGNDADLKVFASLKKALKVGGIDQVNDATVAIWHRGRGFTFERQPH